MKFLNSKLSTLNSYWLALLNWFYPKRCFSCRSELPFSHPKQLCGQCEQTIQPIREPFCVQCGVHLPDGGMHCFHCRREKSHLSLARCSGIFEGPLRDLIHQLKYSGKDYLAEELALLLLRAWNQYPELHESEIVIPVPLHASSLRERGYNQSELLAEKFLSHLSSRHSNADLRILRKALVRIKKTASQTLFDREARLKNMAGAFEVQEKFRNEIKGKNILLMDDVCTSGATLNECAKVLRKCGAKKVFGLTLARD